MSRTFLVTGAASGIGHKLVAELLKRGERVCAADVKTEPMEALRAHAATAEQLLIVALDVRDPDQWQRCISGLVQAWGRLDALMNVAGVIRPGYVHEVTPADVHFHFDVNTKGVIFGTQAAAAQMLRQGHGHIVNIASLAGIAPVPGIALYSASKFAVRGFSLAAALELRDKGIRVTTVCPDAVQTPMLDLQVDYEQAAMTFSGSRVLSTDDVVGVVLGRVLDKAPIEVMIPGGRGWTAKLASAFPSLGAAVFENLRKRGQAQRQKLKLRQG
jgi:3-oxoacyl-[acyl-carrier protein] reductase